MQKELWFERHLWLTVTGFLILTGICYTALLVALLHAAQPPLHPSDGHRGPFQTARSFDFAPVEFGSNRPSALTGQRF